MNEQESWNETARLDDESLRAVFGEGLEETRKRRVIITDREGRTRMDVTLVGAIAMCVFVPVLLPVVAMQVLSGRRTVSLLKPAQTTADVAAA